MAKINKHSSFQLSELSTMRNSRKGGGVNKYVRKDLIGKGNTTDARYRVAVNMVASEEKCWWVNMWLLGNRPLASEKS
jgi:hypothetical protein